MKPFDYCEKKILKKTSFRIAICILYFALNMMAWSIYRTFQMLEYGNGYQPSLVYIVLSEIILWAPFVFVIIRCVLKNGWRWLIVKELSGNIGGNMQSIYWGCSLSGEV